VPVSIRDPEQLRADIGRWGREIRTCKQRLGLTDEHPTIQARLNRIAVAQRLLGLDTEPPHPTCIDVTAIDQTPRSEWICGPECPKEA
jgi:hypothetical protein